MIFIFLIYKKGLFLIFFICPAPKGCEENLVVYDLL
jgi:hypothetical protein